MSLKHQAEQLGSLPRQQARRIPGGELPIDGEIPREEAAVLANNDVLTRAASDELRRKG